VRTGEDVERTPGSAPGPNVLSVVDGRRGPARKRPNPHHGPESDGTAPHPLPLAAS
jgi:hypothetical protein